MNWANFKIFFTGFILASIFCYSFRSYLYEGQLIKYTLLDPASVMNTDRDLLVRFQPLRSSLIDKYTNHEKFTIGLYFEYLPTGSSIVVNSDLRMWPASLIKIPVAIAAMKKVDSGEWSLEDEILILDSDRDSSYGDLYMAPIGTSLSVADLLYYALVKSDNTAHFTFLRNISAEEITDVFSHMGLDDVLASFKQSPNSVEIDNRMTAKHYSVFMRSLYKSTYLSKDSSQYLLKLLDETQGFYLEAGLPENITYTHKTGIRKNQLIWADSGIVHLNRRPYIITVMLEGRAGAGVTEEDAVQLFKEISSEIFSYVNSL